MKDSFFGKTELRASPSRDGHKSDSPRERDYQIVETEKDQTPRDNQIQLTSTTRERTNEQEILPKTPEGVFKGKIPRRILSRGTENEIDAAGASLQSSKFASPSLSKIYST